MAVTFENNYVVLSEERARHINERHVELDKAYNASKFLRGFNITSTLAFLTRKTFKDSADYYIIEEGYKRRHGYFYMYIFKMNKVLESVRGVIPRTRFAFTFPGRKLTVSSLESFQRIHF